MIVHHAGDLAGTSPLSPLRFLDEKKYLCNFYVLISSNLYILKVAKKVAKNMTLQPASRTSCFCTGAS